MVVPKLLCLFRPPGHMVGFVQHFQSGEIDDEKIAPALRREAQGFQFGDFEIIFALYPDRPVFPALIDVVGFNAESHGTPKLRLARSWDSRNYDVSYQNCYKTLNLASRLLTLRAQAEG